MSHEGTHKGCPYGGWRYWVGKVVVARTGAPTRGGRTGDFGMSYDPEIHHRRSIRYKGYDYTSAGAYFVSIVAQGRLCLFGEVVDGEMRLNGAGEMVRRVWDGMPERIPYVVMDEFVVMPNHVHGVIFIGQPLARAAGHTGGAPMLGEVVGAFKSVSTVEYGKGVKGSGWQRFERRLWQRNFFERIVRNEHELGQIREYIVKNPMNWESDWENPTGTNASVQGWENPFED